MSHAVGFRHCALLDLHLDGTPRVNYAAERLDVSAGAATSCLAAARCPSAGRIVALVTVLCAATVSQSVLLAQMYRPNATYAKYTASLTL